MQRGRSRYERFLRFLCSKTICTLMHLPVELAQTFVSSLDRPTYPIQPRRESFIIFLVSVVFYDNDEVNLVPSTSHNARRNHRTLFVSFNALTFDLDLLRGTNLDQERSRRVFPMTRTRNITRFVTEKYLENSHTWED